VASTNGRAVAAAHERHAKRGRPPKFGRRGHVIAVTLPDDVVKGLRKVDQDLAWAIVSLFNKQPSPRAASDDRRDDAELVAVGGRRSLIVVNADVFHDLPGISMIPLHGGRAFLALSPGQGMSDLELAVVDRLAAASVGAREKQALDRLRVQLREWRRDATLRCETRSIIVVERVNGHSGSSAARNGRRGRS
jgi:hypothetical protein